MKTVATVEARMASTRLPGKVMADLGGRPMLQVVVERVSRATALDRIIVATTVRPEDDTIERLAGDLGIGCYRGSVDDVMGRVLGAARSGGATDIVALSGDNPLVDPELTDDVLRFYRAGGYDYVTTTHMHHSRNWHAERTFPVGVSVQVFSARVLEDAASRTADPIERQHSSFAIYDHPERYRLGAFEATGKYAGWRQPNLRLTVDTQDDLSLMRKLFARLPDGFSTGATIQLVAEHPELQALNAHVRQRIVAEEKAHRD